MTDEYQPAKHLPYDEFLDVKDDEEVASPNSLTPREPPKQLARDMSQLNRSGLETDDDPDEEEERPPRRPKSSLGRARQDRVPESPSPGLEDDDDDELDDDDDDDSASAGEQPTKVDAFPVVEKPEGAYDPETFQQLNVSAEVNQLFKLITEYQPHSIQLEHRLAPFIPEFMPSVGDLDAYLKMPRPDGKNDGFGYKILDEPSLKQSDSHVLELELRAKGRGDSAGAVAVKSIAHGKSTHKEVDSWIASITKLRQQKPPATVVYSKNMPELDELMQEWPIEFEEFLSHIKLPGAELECDLNTYCDIILSLLDIPVHKSRAQSLHVLFSLYQEFKTSAHFQLYAET